MASLLLASLRQMHHFFSQMPKSSPPRAKVQPLVLVGKLVTHIIPGTQFDCDPASITTVLSFHCRKLHLEQPPALDSHHKLSPAQFHSIRVLACDVGPCHIHVDGSPKELSIWN